MSRLAVLLAFVHYLFQNKIEQDLLLCNSLESHVTVKKSLSQSLHRTWNQLGKAWWCVRCCKESNDRKNGRVVVHIKEFAPSRSSSHCVLHWQTFFCQNNRKRPRKCVGLCRKDGEPD